MEKNKDITILVADDDREIRMAISKLLSLESYNTIEAEDGLKTIEIINSKEVDLIILDIMMPNLDGLSTMLKLREYSNIPIIILSAKTENSDKVLGLSMGADDYIAKPYNADELLARVKSQIRRYYRFGDHSKAKFEYKNGRLELCTESKLAYLDGEPVKLTATEYKILEFFMKNINQVFSAEKIYQAVWREDSFSPENTVMVHIRRIREKIEINPSEPEYIKVVWGIGYKMEAHKK